ncbi:hypothetical protein BV20DRAFT_1123569 [Pilatotrama ljubarskyi]|nr:hypothetical protein BV20DRAFT_1123569 [Pilatotrama ljubarskyi]
MPTYDVVSAFTPRSVYHYQGFPVGIVASPAWAMTSFTSAKERRPAPPPARTIPLLPVDYGARPPEPHDHRTRSSIPSHKGTARALSTPRFHPHVDPLVAYSHDGLYALPLVWNLSYDPRSLHVLDGHHRRPGPAVSAFSYAHLATRCAVRLAPADGGQPLHSLDLILRHLPLQIEMEPRGRPDRPFSKSDDYYVSVWDVLLDLYHGLRVAVEPQ